MKNQKIIMGFVFLTILTLTPVFNTKASTTSETKLSQLKTKTIASIDARITGLTDFINRVMGKKLGGGDTSQIISDAKIELDALNNAKIKINADTDINVLKTDKDQMQAQFLTTRILGTKGVMTLHAEGMEKRTDIKNDQATQFEIKIAALEAKGVDVTLLKSQLQTLKSKLADADMQYEKAGDIINPISASGTNIIELKANKTTLASAHSLIHIGGQDLKDATALIKLMNKEIKTLSK